MIYLGDQRQKSTLDFCLAAPGHASDQAALAFLYTPQIDKAWSSQGKEIALDVTVHSNHVSGTVNRRLLEKRMLHRGTAVPKFYLHIHEAGETIEDYEGTEFPDARSALAEAERAARDLMAEKVRTGGIIGGQRIDVVDDIHQPVGSVRFRTLLHLGDDG